MVNMSSTKLFDKILIANRGEIAIRIIKTCKKLGIETVAVYSEADANSLYVRLADEAYPIGPAPSPESYLNIPKIIEAIKNSNSQAVHPGYGFLSENPRFAEACLKEGIALIGPSVKAIRDMGDKIEAKKIAIEAGVNTVPGYMGVIKNAEEAVKIAKKIGFPVMVKAAAGGGGRGIRVVHSKEEMAEAFKSTTAEAKNSFSDDRVFIEKFIQQPRHIEIQIIADKFGNVVCLGERECSIQRHHQKVIEEAPSPFIDKKTRLKMYKQVVSLAKNVSYYSAGTVEFIVDQEKNFYFLEMNTRLQVEHCVTELITGVDLVEMMIRVAAGQKLTITQDDVVLNGWAMESRIYSEDPSRGFLPSSGRITSYQEPNRGQNIRIDSGVVEGSEVSMFYDAMIAKLCSHGETREAAIEHMKYGLANYVIRGVAHNMSFLEAVMSHPNFVSGQFSTDFIDKEYPDGFLGAEITSENTRVFITVGTHVFMTEAMRSVNISGQLRGRQQQLSTRWIVSIDGENFTIIAKPTSGGFNLRHERARLTSRSSWFIGSKLFRGQVNGTEVSVKVERDFVGYRLSYGGRTVKFDIRTPRVAELESMMPKRDTSRFSASLKAPIAGKIVNVKVQIGDEVKDGQELISIEAMKMENMIYAEAKCKVTNIAAQPGENVGVGQVIMEFEKI